jgi:hypothetical protein
MVRGAGGSLLGACTQLERLKIHIGVISSSAISTMEIVTMKVARGSGPLRILTGVPIRR